MIKNEAGEIVRQIYNGKLDNGFHRYKWNLRHTGATVFPNIILEGGNPRRGPWAVPGKYIVILEVNGAIKEQTFDLKKDPRLTDVSQEDLAAQFELAMKIRDAEDAANQSIINIRDLVGQLNALTPKNTSKATHEKANAIIQSLNEVAKNIYQVRNQSPKDKIAFPIKLNDRLTGLRSRLEKGDGAPPASFYKVYDELSKELDLHLTKLRDILQNDLGALNKLLAQQKLPTIQPNKK